MAMSLRWLRSAARLPTLPEKLRGGRIEKGINYWKNVATDYKDALSELRSSAARRPFRAVALTGAILGGVHLHQHNPDHNSFRAALLEASDEYSCVPESLRNQDSAAHLDNLWRCFNAGQVRVTDFYLFSLAWRDKYSSESAAFAARCDYTGVSYFEWKDHVLDVGFLGTWWSLRRAMLEADVNTEEWDERGAPKTPSNQLRQMW